MGRMKRIKQIGQIRQIKQPMKHGKLAGGFGATRFSPP
jgi:hypothetical protein